MKEDHAKGSEIRCQNVKTASECGANEHGQQTFLSKATMKSFACEACINLMMIIGSWVENGPEESKGMCEYTGFCDTGKEMPLQALVPAHVAASNEIPAPELVEKNLVQMRAGPTCELCQYVIKEIIKLLDNNQTIEDVIKAAEKVCSLIPRNLAKTCRDLVDIYGPNILHLLLEESDPGSACGTLHMCQGERPAHSVNVARLKSGVFCEVCKKVDGYLDQNLDKNSTKAMILAAFEKACSMLPGVYKDECDEFVEQYEPVLIAALHDELNPDSLCLKIGACPKAASKPPLGTEQCVWGPSYWCKNMETAAQCNAVEHCKKNE
ncbi:prosaposin-like [Dromiciops gliroides]|uniref:prosaposin-like n=1 Tax=Dromiciops gliroides TaxID=33562 RepID=UPI001CC59C75|nr:prosaposin-like [Dromiciops gliroides]